MKIIALVLGFLVAMILGMAVNQRGQEKRLIRMEAKLDTIQLKCDSLTEYFINH